MSTSDLAKLPKAISLERLAAACERRGVDIHDVIAQALTPEMQADTTSGMTMKAQSDLAWKIVDKSEPSQQSVKHSGDKKEPVRLIIEG